MDKNRCNELFKAFAHSHFMKEGSHEYDTAKVAFFYAFEQASQPPAGYKLVPIEPTTEMQAAGAQAIRFDTTPINKLWTGNAVYRAMISAIK